VFLQHQSTHVRGIYNAINKTATKKLGRILADLAIVHGVKKSYFLNVKSSSTIVLLGVYKCH
jgi:uncharacterized membrane protein